MEEKEGSRFQRTSENSHIERVGDVTHVYNPEGTYSIIYGIHGIGGNRAARPIAPQLLPESTSLVFLEEVSPWSENPLGYFTSRRSLIYERDIFSVAERKRIRLAYSDVSFRDNNFSLALDGGAFTATLEAAAGIGLAAKLATTPMSRRELIGKVGYGAAAWLLTPATSYIGRLLSGITGFGQEASAGYRRLSRKIHPEERLTGSLRDTVMAYKSQQLMEKEDPGRRHFTHILGYQHEVMEEALLASPAERLEFLERTKAVWRPAVVPETFYTSAILVFNGEFWQTQEIVEHQELKRLLQS